MTHLCRTFVLSIILCLAAVTAAYSKSPSLDLMPDKARNLAELAVVVIQKSQGKLLDFSPESLKTVDELVLGFKKEGNTPQSMNKTLVILGCYVGEVMVRNLGYQWDNPTDTEMAFGFDVTGIRGKNGGLSNPIGKVFKLMTIGEEDSVMAFYQAFSKDWRPAFKNSAGKD